MPVPEQTMVFHRRHGWSSAAGLLSWSDLRGDL